MERIRARAVGKYATALAAAGTCLVRTASLSLGRGRIGGLLSVRNRQTESVCVRNVTAIATGQDSVGIRSVYADFFSEPSRSPRRT